MGLWEIDMLLTNSIKLIQQSNLSEETKNNIIWNLENIPEWYEFDAGNFQKTIFNHASSLTKVNPYQVGLIVVTEANKQKAYNLIYDWAAFLLNYWEEYFIETDTIESLKTNYLAPIKSIYKQVDFTDYEPVHASLTMYKNGNEWFSEEHNNLIKWFCS